MTIKNNINAFTANINEIQQQLLILIKNKFDLVKTHIDTLLSRTTRLIGGQDEILAELTAIQQ